MFAFLVAGSLRNRLFVLVLSAVLLIWGAATALRLPVDVFPDLNRPTVTIMTEAEGLAPPEVEQLLTWPIESRMAGLPGVARVRSVSGVGLSIVYVEFGWDTDLWRNRQLVGERLASLQAELPTGALPQMGPVNSIMGQIVMTALTAPDGFDPMELREIADFTVRPRLLALSGVSQVIPIGGEVRQYRVSPNPAALRAFGVTVEDVERAPRQFGANTGGGFADQASREFLIRNLGRTRSLEDLGGVVVATVAGQPVALRQVAEVGYAPRLKRGEAGFMGRAAVIVSVEKQPGVDTLRLTREVEAALAELAPGLPPGVKADSILFRQADFIETSVRNLGRVLAEAAAVVAIVLFAFLLNARTTAISLAAIPLSILIAVLVFQALGLSINTMTLGGLAIAVGELVDDAVVDVENVFRRLRENRAAGHPRSSFDVVVSASQEVRSGIVYATAIVVLVFVPLFALQGIEGRLFAPLGQAYIVAILASLLVAVTLTPVLAYLLLPTLRRLDHGDGWLVARLKAANRRVLAATLPRPGTLLAAASLAVAAALAVAVQLPRAFLPPFNEGTFTVNLLLNPGISLAESHRLGLIAERLILEVPEVQRVGRRTGRAELDEHAEGVHSSEIEVALKPGGRPKPEIAADIRARLGVLPVATNVGQPISHRLDHMLSGVRAELALKLYGEDLDTLRALAEELRGKLASVPGLVDLQVERQVRIPQLDIAVDYRRAALYGLQPAAITEQLERLSGGRVVSRLVDGNRRYDVVVRLGDTQRTTRGLRELLIQTPLGWVPLERLADVSESDGPNQILRENGRRRVAVFANTDGRADMARIAGDVRRIVAESKLPVGTFASLEGTFEAQEAAMRTIALLSLLSLALIVAILYSRYRSFLYVGLILLSVPFALVGSVAALWIAGQPLSVASMVGFITLAGIATRNGILKLSHWINLSLHDGLPFGPELVVRGTLERLVPVLMTALTAALALLPLLWDPLAPGKEILHPVAVTIFGGLIAATLLDTMLTPALFLRWGGPALARLRAETETAPRGAVVTY